MEVCTLLHGQSTSPISMMNLECYVLSATFPETWRDGGFVGCDVEDSSRPKCQPTLERGLEDLIDEWGRDTGYTYRGFRHQDEPNPWGLVVGAVSVRGGISWVPVQYTTARVQRGCSIWVLRQGKCS
ncbi:UNVERIFIED_CONTAM: hypothetical protein Sradi_1874100 [Sesamum radiatum]|uniref:Uncharacterized protein n=1 Tax=Sesamum radiatum TaxID=300843 RepID=A0AAW2TXW8_SESRA